MTQGQNLCDCFQIEKQSKKQPEVIQVSENFVLAHIHTCADKEGW